MATQKTPHEQPRSLSIRLSHAESQGLIRVAQLDPELEYLFRHALVQDAAYDSLLKKDQRRLHRIVAESLERAYPDQIEAMAATLAHHYRAAGEKSRAVRYFTLAAERALASYANQEAEALCLSGLALAHKAPDRIRLLRRLGQSLARQARYPETIQVCERAINLCRVSGDLDRAGRLYEIAIRAALNDNQFETALRLGNQGLETLAASRETAGLAALYRARTSTFFFTGYIPEAVESARRAVEIASQAGDAEIQASALQTLGMILHSATGHEGIDLVEQAAQIAESAGLLELARTAHHQIGLIQSVAYWNFDQGRQHYIRAVELAERVGSPSEALHSLSMLLLAEIIAGNREAVERICVQVARDAAALGANRSTVLAGWVLGMRYAYWGTWEQFRSATQVTQAVLRQAQDPYILRAVNNILADVAVQAGEWSEARAALEEAYPLRRADIPDTTRTIALFSMVNSHDGQLEEARRLLSEAHQTAGTSATPGARSFLILAEGALATAEQRWDESISHYSGLSEMLIARDFPVGRLRVLRDWAEVHVRRGEPGDLGCARDMLREARAGYEAIGAGEWVRRVDRRLSEIGQEVSGG